MTPDSNRHNLATGVAGIWYWGAGPSHTETEQVFALYDLDDVPDGSKRDRVYTAIVAIDEAHLKAFVFSLLELAEELGAFADGATDEQTMKVLRKRIRPLGLTITPSGELKREPGLGVEPEALLTSPEAREHVARLSRALSDDDAKLILGTGRELLETVSKVVLMSAGEQAPDKFPALLAAALTSLGLHAKVIDRDDDVGQATKRILGALQQIGIGVNDLRNVRGTGHGRAGEVKLSMRHARLAGGSAVVLATLMLDTLEART